ADGPIVRAARWSGTTAGGVAMQSRAAGAASRTQDRTPPPPPGADRASGADGPARSAWARPAEPPATGTLEMWRRRWPAWHRSVLLAACVSATTGLAVMNGVTRGLQARQAVLFAIPVSAVVGLLLAVLLILIPDWRAAAARRWLIQCLTDVSRVDRKQRFSE